MFYLDRHSVADYYKDDALHVAKEVCRCFDENKDNFTDFTVNVGNTKFNCHKFVLSSCSGFFEALMRTDKRSKSESSCTIHGITPEIFGLILDVFYKGKHVLTEENMVEMWHASTLLEITFLISDCEKVMKDKINLQNFWQIFIEAKLLDSVVVLKKTKEFMVDNFQKIAESDVLMQLSFDDLKYILKHDWCFRTDCVVQAVLKWTCSDDSHLTSSSNKCISASQGKEIAAIFDQDNITLRRSYLGQLFARVPLKHTSTECPIKLLNNKFVLANFGAITQITRVASIREVATKTKILNVESKTANQRFKTADGFLFFIFVLYILNFSFGFQCC
jgi:BTB/POZ domain/BTB And C-terminal Kelch